MYDLEVKRFRLRRKTLLTAQASLVQFRNYTAEVYYTSAV